MATRPLSARKAALSADAPEVAEQEPLDIQAGLDQPSEPIANSDQDEIIDRLAARLGHVPKEQWTRDPANWRDAKSFLEDELPGRVQRLEETNRQLKERNWRVTQAAASAEEDFRRQARTDAQAEILAASREQDLDRVEAATKRLAEIPSGPPPQTQIAAWIAKNPWFETDPVAAAAAKAITASKHSEPVESQLEAAEAEVRRRFPEHFPDEIRIAPEPQPAPRPREEVRLSDTRVPARAPAVADGSRGGTGAVKERGFNDIPSGDRAAFHQKLERKFMNMGLSLDEARTRYAKSYWQETKA